MSTEPESITKTYRWGVVSADEPAGVRSIHGFVVVLGFCLPSGAPTGYQVAFFDADGLPLSRFDTDEFLLFANAASLALIELGLSFEDSPAHVAELIVLAQ